MNSQKPIMRDPPKDGRVLLPIEAEAACHSDRDVFRYLFKDMGPDERDTFETHCDVCIECQTQLEGTRLGIDTFFEEDGRGK
jgi:hypothetical protein